MAWNEGSFLSRIQQAPVKKLTDEEKRQLEGNVEEETPEERRRREAAEIDAALAQAKAPVPAEVSMRPIPVPDTMPEAEPEAPKVKAPAIEDLRAPEPEGPVSQAMKATKKKKIVDQIKESDAAVQKMPTEVLATEIPGQIEEAKKDPELPPAVAKDLNWLEKQYKMLNEKEDEEKKSLEWRQALETIAQSMTQLFAAQAGLKAGVDLSGLKFDKTDFNKKMELLQNKMDSRRAQAEKLVAQEAAEKEKAQKLKMDLDKLTMEKQAQKEGAALAQAKLKIDQDAQALRERMAEADKVAKSQELQMKQEAATIAANAPKEVDPELIVPGFGVARSKKEAIDMRAAIVESKGATKLLEDVIKLGTNVGPLDIERRNLIQQSLNIAIGKLRLSMLGPGTMTKEERESIRESIGDPTKFFSTEDIEKAKIKNLIQRINTTVEDQAKAIIAEPITNETKRRDPKTGKMGIFDTQTKQFLRWE